MCLLKTWKVLLITMIFLKINNAWTAESTLNINSEDSMGFVIHVSTQELLNETMTWLDSKLDQRLETALEKQKNKFMQEIGLGLEQKLEKVLEKLHPRSENVSQIPGINIEMNPKLEKGLERLNGIEQGLASKYEKLLQEIKQLFKEQQHTNDEHFEEMKKSFEKQQNTNKVMLENMKESLEKQQQAHDNRVINKNPCQCISKKKQSRSCAEVMLRYDSKTSGIYDLYLPGMRPFEAYCLADPNKGTPWLIIQRRKDNSTDFYLNWNAYKNGFGNLDTNFFLGLDKIHAMTQDKPHELWIELVDFEGEKRFAKYSTFAIGDEDQKYELKAEGFSGNAKDSLAIHNGMKFSTKDMDNDEHNGGSCAIWYTGAWWYHHCHDSNLNGQYLNGKLSNADEGKGIIWHKWHGNRCSLKYAQMAIRPKN